MNYHCVRTNNAGYYVIARKRNTLISRSVAVENVPDDQPFKDFIK